MYAVNEIENYLQVNLNREGDPGSMCGVCLMRKSQIIINKNILILYSLQTKKF